MGANQQCAPHSANFNMAFGFVLVWASWGILREAMHLLMEGTPPGISLEEVSASLASIDGVADVHHVHAWALTSDRHEFTAHLRVDDWGHGQRVLEEAHDRLRERFGLYFSTLQVEEHCLDESGAEDVDLSKLWRSPG